MLTRLRSQARIMTVVTPTDFEQGSFPVVRYEREKE